jgi:hypothetical protein
MLARDVVESHYDVGINLGADLEGHKIGGGGARRCRGVVNLLLDPQPLGRRLKTSRSVTRRLRWRVHLLRGLHCIMGLIDNTGSIS